MLLKLETQKIVILFKMECFAYNPSQYFLKHKLQNIVNKVFSREKRTIMKTTVSNNIVMSALCCFSTAWCLSSVLMTLGIQRIRDGLSYLSHT